MNIIYSESIEKLKITDIKFVIFFEKNWIYYKLFKIKDEKNREMNTSVKSFKLTKQMTSKYCN